MMYGYSKCFERRGRKAVDIILNRIFFRSFLTVQRERTLRKQVRRTFTVEFKHNALLGRSVIPAKPPRDLERTKRPTSAAPSSGTMLADKAAAALGRAQASERRRVLPSLIDWNLSEPEPEVQPDPPLPRVRRVAPTRSVDETLPDNSGASGVEVELGPAGETGRSVRPASISPRSEIAEPSEATPAAPLAKTRSARSNAAELSRAERWKRRLPRVCW